MAIDGVASDCGTLTATPDEVIGEQLRPDAEVVASSEVSAPWRRVERVRFALVFGMLAVTVLASLLGWLGWRDREERSAQQRYDVFLRAGRQVAENLTTIDFRHADADVQRIVDSSTGTFHDEMFQRSKPLVDVVMKLQSTTIGTVVEAGVESQNDSDATVLAVVSVKTTNAAAPEEQPRSWRMRLTVQQAGAEAKVSGVEFFQ